MMSFNKIKPIFLLLVFISNQLYAQQKEVLLLGTMHTVPPIVKNSYKPLYKNALKYKPDAIYVERVLSSDSISLKNYYTNFLVYADSIRKRFNADDSVAEKILRKELNQFSMADMAYLKDYFTVTLDYANFKYYQYLEKYGIKGKRKVSRNENDDLSHKLAINLGLKILYSMDDQQNNSAYAKNWQACSKVSRENGDIKNLIKLDKKEHRADVLAALTKTLGKKTNNLKHLNNYHKMNSFRYVSQESEACSLGRLYWDLRNERMAKHIANQVEQSQPIKNIVIVGAGHIIGLQKALEKNYPNIKIKLYSEKPWH